MFVYSVNLDLDCDKELIDRAAGGLRDAYGEDAVLKVHRGLYLVHYGGISDDVSRSARLSGPDSVEGLSGVVFRVGQYYSGYTNPKVWEWLLERTSKHAQ